MKNIQSIGLSLCLLFTFEMANAQVLAWDTNANTGNEITFNSTTTDTNLGTSPLSRGVGIDPSTLSNAFSSTNFAATSLADAITADEYVQFTVTPNSGFKVSLTTLDVNFRRSGTGASDFQWQFSLDGFATAGTNAGALINFTSTATNGIAQTQIDLSAIPALQNVGFPNTITFRLYGWNASATGGTFAIGRLAGNDLALGGTTTAITTAAAGSISGRARSASGNGVKHAVIMLTGGDLEDPVYATTNQFGNYQFEDIPVGQTYVLQITSGRYSFQNPSRVINLKDTLTGEDFILEESMIGLRTGPRKK